MTRVASCVYIVYTRAMLRTLSIRVHEDLYDQLAQGAESEERSLSNYVARVLAEAVRLREGHSTLGASVARHPSNPVKKAAKRVPARAQNIEEAAARQKDEAAARQAFAKRIGAK